MSLEFDLNRLDPVSAAADCVVVGLYADGTLCKAGQALDAASDGRLAALAARGDLSGKAGRTGLVLDLAGVSAPRVLVAGLGEAAKLDPGNYLKAVQTAIKALDNGPVRHVLLCLSDLAVTGRDAAWAVQQAVVGADHAAYRYTATKSPSKDNGNRIERVTVLGDAAHRAAFEAGLGVAAGVKAARNLGDLPPNICNPAYLATEARAFAEAHEGAECEVLEREDMAKLGMDAILAVARGSTNDPKLIVLRWNGAGEAKPYALVGKGLTFDAGGINLKVQGGIEEMKYDMCGAAAVYGAFVAAVKNRLPVNLVAVLAAVENMPDGNAFRPSDVLTSMSGKTIEILNTDAEGRLALCDALTFVQKYQPQAIVDVATLTGACMIALGKVASGLMSHHDDLAEELLAAGTHVHDRAWRLPIWEDYQSLLDSSVADVANLGSRWGGAISAGCFLARFVEGQRWAHLDVAGSAFDEGRKGLATGRPVGLLVEWLARRSRES